jgi:hypothetical protein
MYLVWLTYETRKGTAVYIQSAYELGMVRMRAALAGAPDDSKEGVQLDAKASKKVPQKMIGGF